jgi:predicted transcriptional regulator
MATVTIELDDDVLERLRERALDAGQPLEAYISAVAAREALESGGVTAEFVDDVRNMVETYRPVLRRLAQ